MSLLRQIIVHSSYVSLLSIKTKLSSRGVKYNTKHPRTTIVGVHHYHHDVARKAKNVFKSITNVNNGTETTARQQPVLDR